MRTVKKEAIFANMNEAARRLDTTHPLDRKPRNLSSGQQQRAALGWTAPSLTLLQSLVQIARRQGR